MNETKKQRTLPTFAECLDAVNKSKPTALQWFIYSYEPEGYIDSEFRADLLAALEEWKQLS